MPDRDEPSNDSPVDSTTWWSKLPSALKNWCLGFLVLAGVFGAILAVQHWVEGLVDQRVQDPGFLQEISDRVRPAIVFNGEGIIVSDLGGKGLISNLRVTQLEDSNRFTVLISFNEYLDAPPNLECMDSVCGITAERASMNDWKFEIETVQLLAITETQLPLPSRFRLEVVR